MNFNQFTIKAQEAVQKALEIASGYQNQAIEPVHLLKGILTIDEQVIPYLLKKLNVNVLIINTTLDKILESNPKVAGGNPYLSQDSNNVLLNATNCLKEFSDEYVTLEILLLGILKGNETASKLLKDNGITEKDLKAAIQEMRKGSQAKSATSEDTYNALNKFARNLNDLARSGKLDPVIGRDEEIRRVLQILSRRTKNNPILIGEPGVGKNCDCRRSRASYCKWRCSRRPKNQTAFLAGYGCADCRCPNTKANLKNV